MRLLGKALPDLHFNPFYRDLLIVAAIGFMAALALVFIGMMVFH